MGRTKGWTLSDVSKLGGKASPTPALHKSKARDEFYAIIQRACPMPLVYEHQFASPRKFRFDIALPSIKVAFEYEGIMSPKGRHRTVNGYTRDTVKYNLAALMGWRVFRYTAINYKDVVGHLKELTKMAGHEV